MAPASHLSCQPHSTSSRPGKGVVQGTARLPFHGHVVHSMLRQASLAAVQRQAVLLLGLLLCLQLQPLLPPASARQLSVQQQPEQQVDVRTHQGRGFRSLLESPSAGDGALPWAVLSDIYSNISGANSNPFFSTWVSAFNDTHNTTAVCSTDGQSLVGGVKCEGATVVGINISSVKADLVTIPTSLGLLTSLTSLKLSFNLVAGGNGTLPSSLGSLTGLKELDVSNMGLSGELPSSFSSLTGLTSLKLNDNNLTGTIPEYLSGFEALVSLEMQANKFVGKLPGLFSGLNSLTLLFVNNNTLTGGLPPELGQATWLVQFKAQFNPFGGHLPESYGNFVNATHIHLKSVQVTGEIPQSWGNLKRIQILHLEDNMLSGSIPSSFGELTSLQEIRLNNNSLIGSMPACWVSIQQLATIEVGYGVKCPSGQGQACCGGAPQPDVPFCKKSKCGIEYCSTCYYDSKLSTGAIVGIAVAAVVAVGLVVVLLVWWWRRRHRLEDWERDLDSAFRRYSLAEMLEATNNFSADRALGKGSFGTVYVGKGPKGETWAVKRAGAVERRMGSSQASAFEDEVRMVHKLRHKNLVQLLGYCNEGMEQVLVYEYMAQGALSKHLYNEHKDPLLDLEQRLQVAVDTAEGLKYLHNFADPPLVHRDIKPDNVLLTADLRAEVADFGLAKGMEDPKKSMFTRVAGTRGYLDPEYVSCEKVTPRCDVYSFGVMLLELITGRPATVPDPEDEDNFVHVTGWALPYVKDGDVHLIADPRIAGEESMPTLLELGRIAVDCVQIPGRKRPSMDDVCTRLAELQREHLARQGCDNGNRDSGASASEVHSGDTVPVVQ